MNSLPDLPLFYLPHVDGQGIFQASEDEATHAIRVLRLSVGDQLLVTNGRGSLFTAEVASVGKRDLMIQVLETCFTQAEQNQLHIAIAPTKNIDRFEWFLEKATEVGVASVTPIICQRSERKEVRRDRLEKIIVAAAKQSLKANFPVLHEAVPFSGYLKNLPHPAYIAHCAEGEKASLKQAFVAKTIAHVLIGPEGDFTPSEMEAATQAGVKGLSLGEERLRTETAALMVVMAHAALTNS